jgi:hypothetical protein
MSGWNSNTNSSRKAFLLASKTPEAPIESSAVRRNSHSGAPVTLQTLFVGRFLKVCGR